MGAMGSPRCPMEGRGEAEGHKSRGGGGGVSWGGGGAIFIPPPFRFRCHLWGVGSPPPPPKLPMSALWGEEGVN